MTDVFPDYDADPAPDDFCQEGGAEEKVFAADDFHPTRTVKAKKVARAAPGIASVVRPASELLQAKEEASVAAVPETTTPADLIPSAPVPVAPGNKKRGRPKSPDGMTKAQWQAKWRAANPELAREKARVGMQQMRARKRAATPVIVEQ